MVGKAWFFLGKLHRDKPFYVAVAVTSGSELLKLMVVIILFPSDGRHFVAGQFRGPEGRSFS